MKVGQLIRTLMESVRTGSVPADATVLINVPGVITTVIKHVVSATFIADRDLGKIEGNIINHSLSPSTETLVAQRFSGEIYFTRDEINDFPRFLNKDEISWPGKEKYIEQAKAGVFLGHKVASLSREDLYLVIGKLAEDSDYLTKKQ